MMQGLKLSDIPEYLRGGEFYKTLAENSDDPNEILYFESDTVKQNTRVKTVRDCDNLLNGLRFWGVSMFCEEIVAFVLADHEKKTEEVLSKYEEHCSYLHALRKVPKKLFIPPLEQKVPDTVIESGCVELVIYLVRNSFSLPKFSACTAAALSKNETMLAFVHQHNCILDEHAAEVAVIHGNICCLEYIRRNGVRFTESLFQRAARYGQLSCLEYLYKHFCEESNHLTLNAITRNYVPFYFASGGGHLSCLHFLCSIGCPQNKRSYFYAAREGHLHCLKYLHESGCLWDKFTCDEAVQGGHLHCLKYAHENGCELSPISCDTAVANGHLNCLRYLHLHLPVCCWDESTCKAAARKGSLPCLQYLHEHGCPWDERTSTIAAANKNVECLYYARNNGCPVRADLASMEDNPCYRYLMHCFQK